MVFSCNAFFFSANVLSALYSGRPGAAELEPEPVPVPAHDSDDSHSVSSCGVHGRLLPKLLLDELGGDAYVCARPEGGVGCTVERRRRQTTQGRLAFYYFILIVVFILILIIVHIAIIDVFIVPDYVDVCLLGFFI